MEHGPSQLDGRIAYFVKNKMNYPVLYGMVRNDMDSMNPGKAEAHSGHLANAFIDKTIVGPLLKGKEPNALAMEWRKATSHGFGTQINLDANIEQMKTAVKVASMLGFEAELTTDPTYPYEVSNEVFELIPEETHTVDPVQKRGGWVCFRSEVTGAYIFMDKNDPIGQSIVQHFKLKP